MAWKTLDMAYGTRHWEDDVIGAYSKRFHIWKTHSSDLIYLVKDHFHTSTTAQFSFQFPCGSVYGLKTIFVYPEAVSYLGKIHKAEWKLEKRSPL